MFNGFATQISVVQDDYGYSLPFTLQDNAGNVVDLTSATSVKFNCQLDSDYPQQFDNNMVVTSAAAGQCKYVVVQTDFPTAGVWNAQIVVSYTGEVITFDGIQITVASKLPLS
jgi:hypothetical protein